jgi:hypothetical protein
LRVDGICLARSTSVKKKKAEERGGGELYKMHISISISAAPRNVMTDPDQWNGSMNSLSPEGADRCPRTDVLNPLLAGRALHGNPAVHPLASLRGGGGGTVRSKSFHRRGKWESVADSFFFKYVNRYIAQ